MSNSTLQTELNKSSSFTEATDQTPSFIEYNNSLFDYVDEQITNYDERFASVFHNSIVYSQVAWGILLAIVIVGTIGNIFVIILMSDRKLASFPFAVYLKCLAVSDSAVLGSRLLEQTEIHFNLPSIIHTNDAACKLLLCLHMFSTVLSPWLVVGLTLDRCVCVCFPLSRARLCTRNKAIVVCSGILAVSFGMVAVILVEWKVVYGMCTGPDSVYRYFIFLRLVISSTLPCVLILVLNVITIVRIQKSNNFRNTFVRPRTNLASQASDGSMRPLVLISILAFVTLLPASVSESAGVLVLINGTGENGRNLLSEMWPYINMVFFLNFAQNFYILIGSSAKYRYIMRRKLKFCNAARSGRRSGASRPDLMDINCSASGTTGVHLSLVSTGIVDLTVRSDTTESTLSSSSSPPTR